MSRSVILIEEADGSPSVWGWKTKMPDGSLTDNGDGTLTYNGAGTITGDLTVGSESAGYDISVIATLGTEKITWTTAGWDEGGVEWTVAGTPVVITHATGNTTALTSTLASAIVAGVTYKVVITYSQAAGTCSYTLGGVAGAPIATSATSAVITDYITAATTAQMIITPLTTSNIIIASISIKALTNGTGDLTVSGNLIIRSQTFAGMSSSAYPGYSFLGAPTSGLYLYYPPGGSIGIAVSGTAYFVFGTGTLSLTSNSARINMGVSEDLTLLRDGAGTLQLGADAATATAQTIKAADSSTGGVAGADLTMKGGTPGSGGTYGRVKIAQGTTGGMWRAVAESTATITAAASATITLSIPIGAKIIGTQLRVDTALTGGETWNAAYSGGAAATIAHEEPVAKQTKVNVPWDGLDTAGTLSLQAAWASPVTITGVTNITITPHAGGSFTAAGVIHAWVTYEIFDTLADAA